MTSTSTTGTIIRVKRRLDEDEDEQDAIPSTLFIKKVRVSSAANSESNAQASAPDASMVFRFNHSTNSSYVGNDPRLLIPRVKSVSRKNQISEAGDGRAKLVADMLSESRNARFKIVSQNRVLAGDGSQVKILDVAKEEADLQDGDDATLPESVRAMMQEYTKSQIGPQQNEEAKYVYDVYFHEGEVSTNSQLIDSHRAIAFELNEDDTEQVYFNDDDGDDDDGMDDDEDSNAEDDWRNEYPDSDIDEEMMQEDDDAY
ncbi:hypothetical protein HDU80_002337 [Chytriomyces hyalinus]|nr:hypothetical protein HDU80_002337 [Chytriomyces hyalinus]